MTHPLVVPAAIVAALACVTVVVACGGSSDAPTASSQSSAPQITGCNSVAYKGTTFSNLGCAPGIASFDATINQNGVTAKFHVVCSSGCVSSVTVI